MTSVGNWNTDIGNGDSCKNKKFSRATWCRFVHPWYRVLRCQASQIQRPTLIDILSNLLYFDHGSIVYVLLAANMNMCMEYIHCEICQLCISVSTYRKQ